MGVLWHAGSAEQEGKYLRALIDGFRDFGYVEGQNIYFEHRFPNEEPARFQSCARELVALKPDLIVTISVAAATVANVNFTRIRASRTISGSIVVAGRGRSKCATLRLVRNNRALNLRSGKEI